jgi:hypothetical protein
MICTAELSPAIQFVRNQHDLYETFYLILNELDIEWVVEICRKRITTIACVTLFAQPLAMATTQLVSAIRYEDARSWQVEPKAAHTPLRMSWVVVTDGNGKRQLRVRGARLVTLL